MHFDARGPLELAAHAAITDRRGRVLLLRRPDLSAQNPGRWELPGGRLNPGEGIALAVTREVKRETGLDIVPGRLLGAGAQELSGGRTVHMVLGVVDVTGDVALSAEHAAHRWVTPNGLSRLPLSDWMTAWVETMRE